MKRKLISAIIACLLAMPFCACTQGSDHSAAGETISAGQAYKETAPVETASVTTSPGTDPESIRESSEEQTLSEETAFQESAANGTENGAFIEPAETESFSSSVLEGEFAGWADNHTVEVIVEGVPTAFQVEDEDVKTILESISEGTAFSFKMEQEGEVRRIVAVAQE